MIPPAPARLSRLWFPSGGIAASGIEDGHAKLVRAGFLRPSHSGIFHMLPLGRRVQHKVEGLVARHMEDMLAASRVSLSSISAQSLWEKSGRLPSIGSELFKFSDRKNVEYLLGPTHEEEITSLVAQTVKSYKELPLRLFQVTPKYRDEFRPRHGLLRGREFVMKDLYSFDSSVESALDTYNLVRKVYSSIFAEMELPVLAAQASSGDMGGNLSHEYHLPMSLGEDRVISCDNCDYVANEEVAESTLCGEVTPNSSVEVWRGITKDRTRLVNVWYPRQLRGVDDNLHVYTDADINVAEVKSIVPDLDAGVEDVLPLWMAATTMGGTAAEVVHIVDGRLPHSFSSDLEGTAPKISSWPPTLEPPKRQLRTCIHSVRATTDSPLNILRIRTGDQCPRCPTGHLKAEKAMELGHTFFLGTRYSEPLGATISMQATGHKSPLQMGCYGIGISRIIGAVAEVMADKKGLNWPVAIAPYSCVIIPGKEAGEGEAIEVYHQLNDTVRIAARHFDAVLDDRQRPLPWKLTDADLIGFPVIVILGREWRSAKRVEVQCRRLGVSRSVDLADLPKFVSQLHNPHTSM
ncbi:putative prolyl-tRNA synthetase [Podospora australis]|uniref:proline--tRNA ligase n=1 Tax=Podospora australis TaxID=1536484 RepID=A0AAN6WHL8_9PEZI|nr:putative prolyl-tRNA synthetase [Podospora australis]